ncbi:MAG: hydrogenase maturation protease, partial [Calditrichaeota bacterium]
MQTKYELTLDKPILILGIGNLLMGDEGAGVHVVRYLDKNYDLKNADIVDGGTGGFHLLEYFHRYPRVILVDATMDGKPPGTVQLLKPKFSGDYPPTLTAHDIGLKNLLDALQLTNHQPDVWLYTISIARLDKVTLKLSAEIEKAIPKAARQIVE